MNWTNFLLILTLLYLTYYGLNLLYDLFRIRKPPKDDSDGEVLFFDEDTKPQLILPNEEPLEDFNDLSHLSVEKTSSLQLTNVPNAPMYTSSNLIQSTGGVGLRELFSLAKGHLIEYTGAISY